MALLLHEVSLEVIGLGVVTLSYTAFLLRRWWFSRNLKAGEPAHIQAYGEVGAKNTKVKEKTGERAFGGTSFRSSTFGDTAKLYLIVHPV